MRERGGVRVVQPVGAVMTRPLKIIVVEDYNDYRAAICDALTQDGHDVIGVAIHG